MRKMVEELLTLQQKFQIVEIIKDRCKRFQFFENQYENLFYEPYTQMRHKHTVTSAIISGFAPGKFHINGITSEDLNYGLNDKLVQPELHCQKGIFHIYSDGSDLKGKKIIEHCKEMNSDITEPPVFFLLIVFVNNDGVLNKVEVRLPKEDGTIHSREVIYESPKVVAITA